VAVVQEVPEGVGGEPVVAVAVQDHGVVVGDPTAPHKLAELLGAEEVALHLVLKLLLPVEPDRSGDVALRVQGGVLVDLDDPYRVVVEVLGDPVRLHQDVIRVVSQSAPPKLFG
jgi:hypothetical protein